MNGPEHYREAERLHALAESESWYEEDGRLPRVMAVLAAAQAHATLALAAATVDAQRGGLTVWQQWPQPRDER